MKNTELSARQVFLLRKVRAQILKTPTRYNQDVCNKVRDTEKCGTPSCIMGWYAFFNRRSPLKNLLTVEQEHKLYWPNQWPGRMRQPNAGQPGHKYDWDSIPAKLAAKRITLFIKTDGRK